MRPFPFLAALALAGCVAAPAAQISSAESAEAGPLPWSIDRCAFMIAAVKARTASLLPLLPPGFAPVSSAGVAEIHFDAYRCARVSWLGGETLEDAGYASVYVPVVPPNALRESGYGNYFVKLDTLVADPDAQAALAAAGLPARSGDALVDVTETPGALAVDARAELGDVGFRVLAATGPASASGPLPFMEYTPLAQGGLARWHARLHDAEIGAGAGVVHLSGWPAAVLGAEAMPATVIAGTWNLDQADVAWPVAWP